MKTDSKKLFRVTLRGMISRTTGMVYGVSYVVADCPTTAYKMVDEFLNREKLGFTADRELYSVELIAETGRYTDTGTLLYL